MKTPATPAIEHQSSSTALHASKKGNAPFFGPAAGNEAPFFAPRIQPKLTIGQPGDKYEQEADAVADRVVQRLANPGPPVAVQKKCQDCAEKEKLQRKEEEREEPAVMRQMENEQEEAPPVQTKAEAGASSTPSLQSRLSSAKGSGAQMDKSARAPMEAAFGQDFGQVRIHTDSSAAQMNRELNARAFTHGRDIYFNAGEYSPGSTEGRRLLAHELVHVGQQGGDFKNDGISRNISNVFRKANSDRRCNPKYNTGLFSARPDALSDFNLWEKNCLSATCVDVPESANSKFERKVLSGNSGIVYKPKKIIPANSVIEFDVMLHFHGYNGGYRENPPVDKIGRFSEQLNASLPRSKDLLLVLPQGSIPVIRKTGNKKYYYFRGYEFYNLDIGTFLKNKVENEIYPNRSVKYRQKILSGHSGGEYPLTRMMTMQRHFFNPIIDRGKSVILFDAINKNRENMWLLKIRKWISEDIKNIKIIKTKEKGLPIVLQIGEYLRKSFKLRAYYTLGSYKSRHEWLAQQVRKEINRQGIILPNDQRIDLLGLLHKNYKFIPIRSDHTNIMAGDKSIPTNPLATGIKEIIQPKFNPSSSKFRSVTTGAQSQQLCFNKNYPHYAISWGLLLDSRAHKTLKLAFNKTGKESVCKWMEGFVQESRAHFLNIPVSKGIHREMFEKMKKAEIELLKNINNRKFGIKNISGWRNISPNSSFLSWHCLGLAVDINYEGNPWIGRSTTVKGGRKVFPSRAIYALSNLLFFGNIFDVFVNRSPKGLSSRQEAEFIHNVLQKASLALILYFSLIDNTTIINVNKITNKLSASQQNAFHIQKSEDKVRWLIAHNGIQDIQYKQLIKMSTTNDMRRLLNILKARNADQININAVKSIIQRQKGILRIDFQLNKGGARDPGKGFLDLDKRMVSALVNAGLKWGGMWSLPSHQGKDIMHFYLDNGKIKRRM